MSKSSDSISPSSLAIFEESLLRIGSKSYNQLHLLIQLSDHLNPSQQKITSSLNSLALVMSETIPQFNIAGDEYRANPSPRMIPDSHQRFQLIPSITKCKAYLTQYPLDSHMLEGTHICVVVPARNEEEFIGNVLGNMPTFVDLAVVIDDNSTDSTGQTTKTANVNCETIVIQGNGDGVGAAIDLGYRTAIQRFGDETFLCAVMAGDAQMHPDDLISVCKPIIDNTADHVKEIGSFPQLFEECHFKEELLAGFCHLVLASHQQ